MCLLRKSNDIVFITTLNTELVKLSLNLQGLPTETVETTDGSNSKLLVILLSIVSGILAACLVAFIVHYLVRTKSFKRQIRVLTDSTFGSNSEEVNKNIKTLPNLPNTNIFANEQSNPGFNNQFKRSKDYDKQSIISSDSDDFAGIYDNPIFNISQKLASAEGSNNPLGKSDRSENGESSFI